MVKHKTPKTGLKLVAIVLIFRSKNISRDFTIKVHVQLMTLGDKLDPRAIIYTLLVKAH